jgi:hypothetical protein
VRASRSKKRLDLIQGHRVCMRLRARHSMTRPSRCPDPGWCAPLSLLVGSFPGTFVGSSMSARIPDLVLRYVLAGVLIIVGARLALDVPGHVCKRPTM